MTCPIDPPLTRNTHLNLTDNNTQHIRSLLGAFNVLPSSSNGSVAPRTVDASSRSMFRIEDLGSEISDDRLLLPNRTSRGGRKADDDLVNFCYVLKENETEFTGNLGRCYPKPMTCTAEMFVQETSRVYCDISEQRLNVTCKFMWFARTETCHDEVCYAARIHCPPPSDSIPPNHSDKTDITVQTSHSSLSPISLAIMIICIIIAIVVATFGGIWFSRRIDADSYRPVKKEVKQRAVVAARKDLKGIITVQELSDETF
ncbi:hypothetical protein AB6A40_009708 [Gnathostoma spinigerum]|uniref:Uncharacterized protein n=1 Tax=Gnathostoma spinigerum TaxID=75299 RepID=A0ABD6F032_9BILA